uniref:Uncharacterized protein n=1 Tax=Anguilla anguilla TaxID=7936 RepID=A0A0E9RWF9_ANGAN
MCFENEASLGIEPYPPCLKTHFYNYYYASTILKKMSKIHRPTFLAGKHFNTSLKASTKSFNIYI